MPYFDYRQNNSGGSFAYEEWKHSVFVIVEAKSAREADRRAEEFGLYFDGYGDCSCCGGRWYAKADSWDADQGDDVPSCYGEPITPDTMDVPFLSDPKDAYVIIHHLDGRTEAWFWSNEKNEYTVKFK